MRMNATGVQSADDVKRFDDPAEGQYHVLVKSVDEFPEKVQNAIFLNLEILKGTVPGQEGKEYRMAMFLNDDGGPGESMLKAAIVLGLLKPGQEADVDWQQAENVQFVIKLEKTKDKKGVERLRVADWGLGMWDIDHKDVAAVPKDQEAITIWRGTKGAPAQQQSTQQQGQPAGAGAAAGGDEWADV